MTMIQLGNTKPYTMKCITFAKSSAYLNIDALGLVKSCAVRSDVNTLLNGTLFPCLHLDSS